MKKLALIVGARPQSCERLAIVRLQAGTWMFSTEDLRDSKLNFRTGLSSEIKEFDPKALLIIPESTYIQFVFAHRGTERHFNVYGEYIS